MWDKFAAYARLDELINSTETAKQSLRMEHEGLSSRKEPEIKKKAQAQVKKWGWLCRQSMWK